MRNMYGFEQARDVYGFEKRADAEADLGEAAGLHGFRGPGYSDDPGTPVQMSMVDPGLGYRFGRALGHGALGSVVGGLGGKMIGDHWGRGALGDTIGTYLGGTLGAVNGWANAPKQLMLSPQAQQAQGGGPDVVDADALMSQMPPEMAAQMAEGLRTGQGGVNNPPKQASDVYGFSKEALTSPGLLGQMSGALRSMGRAGGVAAQRASNMYNAQRRFMNGAMGQSMEGGAARPVIEAARAGMGSLMKTQAGKRLIGAGAGLAGLGTAGAGALAYGALKDHNDAAGAPVNPVGVVRQNAGLPL